MPKPKPDQVIRHEIVLGRSERELIEGALVAYQVNKIATPAVALISDESAMKLIFAVLATYLGFTYILPPTLNEIGDIYADWKGQYDAAKEAGLINVISEINIAEATSDVLIDSVTGLPLPVSTPVSRAGLAVLLDAIFKF